MLALANTDLTDFQAKALGAIYSENVALVNLFGILVTDLVAIAKEHNEIAYLENLYRSSPDEESEGTTATIEEKEIGGSTGVDGSEVRDTEAPGR